MPFTLNPNLNVPALAGKLERDRRVQVRNLLSEDSADRLLDCLEQQTPWSLTYYDDKGPGIIEAQNLDKIPAPEMGKLQARIYRHAMNGFGYVYSLYHQAEATRSEGPTPAVLDEFFNFMAGDTMLGLIRNLLDDQSPKQVDAQATRFGPGSFLGYHNDQQHGANRKCAYVLNLTRKWRPDWNGYLQFYDETGNSPIAWKPDFNTLNLFKVPQAHVVTCIPPYAGAYRYAVSGWYRG
ncbi:MAG: 2OG-Fe(II) oxygenase family protein [Wenzhouxiangellaceae bacterium]|nr:2OG-Fe(II) oxygenase family protein [Wenzhouxiangellaceae bacterium]